MGLFNIYNLCDAMNVLKVKKDPNLKFLDANEIWLEYAGFKTLDKAIGQDDKNCSWADYVEIYEQHEIDAINGKVYGAIQPCASQYTEFCWFYNYKYPEYDKNRNVIALNVFAHEIVDLQMNHNLNNFQKHNIYNSEQLFLDKPLEENLSERETEVLFYLLHMLTAKKIAKLLNISMRTVEKHIEKIKNKLRCRTKSQIIEYAYSKGYIKIIPLKILKNKMKQLIDVLKN